MDDNHREIIAKDRVIEDTEKKLNQFVVFLQDFLKKRLGFLERRRLRFTMNNLGGNRPLEKEPLCYSIIAEVPKLFSSASPGLFSPFRYAINIWIYFEKVPLGFVIKEIKFGVGGNRYTATNTGLSILKTEEAYFYIVNELSQIFKIEKNKIEVMGA